jgi:hypothetical protein
LTFAMKIFFTIALTLFSVSFCFADEAVKGRDHSRLVIPEVIERISKSRDPQLIQSKLRRGLEQIEKAPNPLIVIQIKMVGDGSSEAWYTMNLKTKEILEVKAPEIKSPILKLTFPHFGNNLTVSSDDLEMKFLSGSDTKLVSVVKRKIEEDSSLKRNDD